MLPYRRPAQTAVQAARADTEHSAHSPPPTAAEIETVGSDTESDAADVKVYMRRMVVARSRAEVGTEAIDNFTPIRKYRSVTEATTIGASRPALRPPSARRRCRAAAAAGGRPRPPRPPPGPRPAWPM